MHGEYFLDLAADLYDRQGYDNEIIENGIFICNDFKCEEWCFCSKIKIECPFADIETYSNFEKKLCSRGNKLK